jgi:two-component system, NarL family, sensor histidine kinase UhpB
VESIRARPKRRPATLIFVGVCLSALFWVLEAAVHVIVFEDSGLAEQVFAPHGHEVWMRLTVVAMFMAFGFYSHRMVEARGRAEEQARTASAQVSQIFETAADGMRVVDRDFTVLCANETFTSLVGMPGEAVVGRKCFDVFRGDLCDTPGCPLKRILGGEERIEYDAEKTRPNGQRIPCIVTATPFRGPDGEVIGIVEDFKDISERVQAESELMASRERLQELTSHLQVVREEERRRIAREVHDELGQALTALNMDIHWLKKRLPADTPALAAKADAMAGLIMATVRSVRRICSELRPGILDDFGLAAAIEWQLGELSARTGIRWELSADPPDLAVPEDLSIALFRIFQEALTNCARHARASAVQVELHEDGDELVLRVCDDGIGIGTRPASPKKTFGLLGIRERVRDFDGRMEIGAAPGGGTCLRVSVPIPAGGVER